ncbi:hypothetical protein EON81_17120 [bacterium]|nr:MAG: hypothetical protein EON81_17120 [bacterium]
MSTAIDHEEGWRVREWRAHMRFLPIIDFDHRGRVVFVDDRCIYAWEGCPEGKPKKIVDLTEGEFKAIPPPPDYKARF